MNSIETSRSTAPAGVQRIDDVSRQRRRFASLPSTAVAFAIVVLAAILGGCGTFAPGIDAARVLAPTGKLRIAVYGGSPTSIVRNVATGEIKGVSVDIGEALARRLGVPFEIIEYPRVAEVVAGIKAGAADFTITNASPARAQDVDFSQPVVAIELGYLLPPGSAIAAFDAIDSAGVRIGVSQGSTSQSTLPSRLKNATVVPAPSVSGAIAKLNDKKLDAFATNKGVLYEMTDTLPGSRVLDGRWGVEHLAVAVPKGRDSAMPWLRAFVDESIAQGLVAKAAARAGLRGTARD